MKYYAVIDTNVLVSAMLRWKSVPGSILELTFDGPIIPVLTVMSASPVSIKMCSEASKNGENPIPCGITFSVFSVQI